MHECEAPNCKAQGTKKHGGGWYCPKDAAKLETAAWLARDLSNAIGESREVAAALVGQEGLGEFRIWSRGNTIFLDTGQSIFRLKATKTRSPPGTSPPMVG